METEVITIDGPTSSGKNSVGLMLAQKLGYQYIDSGSIYRAGCIVILKNNIPLTDKDKLLSVFQNLQIEIKQEDHDQRIFANGEDITDQLHNTQVTGIISEVSAIRDVREATKKIQYRLVNSQNTVMTGRDIGSEIFPQAKHKFFITADVEIRAQRRYKQLALKDQSTKFEDVLEAMKLRDQKDSTRAVSPLRVPENAVVIDNSNLTIEQTVEEMLKNINA